MKASTHYLGIEGGGTRSTLVLADAQGKAMAELQGGPANLKLLILMLIQLSQGVQLKLPPL